MLKRFLSCIALCLIFPSSGPSQASSKIDSTGWTVNDLTGALALASIEERDSLFTVSLKNKSTEMITAVALSFREDAHHYQDWLNAETPGLAPGSTFSVTVGPDDVAPRKIDISAVIFEDGSGKGNTAQLDLMNCHRFGQILEGARIGKVLRNRPASHDDAGMKTLAQKIGKMPDSSDDAFNSLEGVNVPGISIAALKGNGEKLRNALHWGVSATRERALRQMENVKQLPVASTDENVPSRAAALSFILEQYDKQNKKAAALLARTQRGR
jgi:hypothetical protein